MGQVFELHKLSKESIVAVVTIDDIESSGYLCDALLNGGITTIELTLRTKNAFDVMSYISKNYSDIIVGAGTVLSISQLEKSIQSGAVFAVAPGFDISIVEKSKKLNFPFAPGVRTPSDIQMAIKYGCNVLKFFPAEPLGGMEYLNSIAAPFSQNKLRFIPLGGININVAAKYLESELILAIGGSWIAEQYLINNGNWTEIQHRANEIRNLITKIRGTSFET